MVWHSPPHSYSIQSLGSSLAEHLWLLQIHPLGEEVPVVWPTWARGWHWLSDLSQVALHPQPLSWLPPSSQVQAPPPPSVHPAVPPACSWCMTPVTRLCWCTEATEGMTISPATGHPQSCVGHASIWTSLPAQANLENDVHMFLMLSVRGPPKNEGAQPLPSSFSWPFPLG